MWWRYLLLLLSWQQFGAWRHWRHMGMQYNICWFLYKRHSNCGNSSTSFNKTYLLHVKRYRINASPYLFFEDKWTDLLWPLQNGKAGVGLPRQKAEVLLPSGRVFSSVLKPVEIKSFPILTHIVFHTSAWGCSRGHADDFSESPAPAASFYAFLASFEDVPYSDEQKCGSKA